MVQYWYCMLSYILKQNDDGGCYIQNRKAWFRNLKGTSCVYSKNSQFQIFVKLEICCFSIFHPKELWAWILHWQCLAAFLSRNMAEPPLLKDHIFMTCRNIVYAQFSTISTGWFHCSGCLDNKWGLVTRLMFWWLWSNLQCCCPSVYYQACALKSLPHNPLMSQIMFFSIKRLNDDRWQKIGPI